MISHDPTAVAIEILERERERSSALRDGCIQSVAVLQLKESMGDTFLVDPKVAAALSLT